MKVSDFISQKIHRSIIDQLTDVINQAEIGDVDLKKYPALRDTPWFPNRDECKCDDECDIDGAGGAAGGGDGAGAASHIPSAGAARHIPSGAGAAGAAGVINIRTETGHLY